jgi:hypothetical protein
MQIAPEDFLYFINRALDGMLRIVEELGDARVNWRPDFPGANSPYAILYHCVGCTNYWLGALLAGRQVSRDRNAEFQAQGTVADMRQAVRALQQQVREDIMHVQGDRPLAYPDALLPRHVQWGARHWSQGKALVHAYEELSQHHGQMEISRDIIMQRAAHASDE